jgi:uncharacterized protein YdbL (DUF1318 family)
MNNLTPAQILALSRVLTDKKIDEARKAIGHPVTTQIAPFSVSCSGGTLSVGESVEYTPTVHLPLLDVLVIALHKAGFQRENIMAMVADAASDALRSGDRVGDTTKSDIDFVKSEVEALQAAFSINLPKKSRAGVMKISAKWS